ncbi:MAG: ABC transporter substrate-binding protein [Xanthobacteraceae bacterium]|jgi:putative ABC transport system substrate-binding protein
MAIEIQRREFLTLLGGAAATWPLAAQAQQSGTTPRIGLLVGLPEGDPEGERWVKALLTGLDKLGWKSGANVQIDLRWGGTDPDGMLKLAKELVALRPDVIQVTTTPATAAILRETHTIPVVFAIVSDPVGSGFVQSFPRPGGNVTGFVNIEASVGGKWLELLKELAPRIIRVAVLFNPKTAPQSSFYLKSMQAAALPLGVTLAVNEVGSADEIKAAIADLAKSSDAGLVVTPDIFTIAQARRELIVALADRYRIPAVYFIGTFISSGGLVSYGVDHPDLLRRAADYIDRILKGEKPENLPVQLPTRFELAVNLKTAKALGLTVPSSLLATADEVIE